MTYISYFYSVRHFEFQVTDAIRITRTDMHIDICAPIFMHRDRFEKNLKFLSICMNT